MNKKKQEFKKQTRDERDSPAVTMGLERNLGGVLLKKFLTFSAILMNLFELLSNIRYSCEPDLMCSYLYADLTTERVRKSILGVFSNSSSLVIIAWCLIRGNSTSMPSTVIECLLYNFDLLDFLAERISW